MGGWQGTGETIIMTSLIACPALAMVVVGIVMVRSAVTGRGIEPPGEDAPASSRFHFSLRGLIGGGFVLGGLSILGGIVASFL